MADASGRHKEEYELSDDSSSKSHQYDSEDRSSLESSSAQIALRKESHDVESQQPAPTEHLVSTRIKLLFLAAYFFLNLFLTLSNKSVLGKARSPWLLTAVHASATSIGCFAMLGFGVIKLTDLGTREHLVLVAFSFLFTINIAISNVSLAMVSVPFHQIMRSTCPVVTILIYRLLYGRYYPTQTYLTMIPLIFGVGLSTAGDYNFTLAGFLMTGLGVILASVKTVATNRLMTGPLKLPALELLLRMSPLAAVQCVIYACMTGEVERFRNSYLRGDFSNSFGAALVINALTAFCLNFVGFQANKMAGALTITVCGNVKQALTIGLGIVLFHVDVGLTNAIGMLITIGGAVWYSKVELDNKRSKPR
ncbi:hypothetical protein DOTSEDRAFT_70200 [Dothistroma septosporum NZE10]|uniref:Sugar phosphate transporter domain-containing protein n=1 Tax=Dothistroma septosporum (strain NZE10 / CBS 128990) TaxID=675120 RepID=N1PRQ4_DOTSN|nr:hypothetical protein DOTSEDRAFT_70200 [Dothistroma septosporum NZE10]